MAMVAAPGPIGQVVFVAAKVWLLALPLVFHLWVDRGRPSWSPARRGGLGIGSALGLAVGAAIVLAFWAVRPHIDPSLLREAVDRVDLEPALDAGAAAP